MTAWQGFSRFLGDRRGNFGMMTAILLPVLLGAGGIAMDVTNMMISKTQLQDAADAAALAASTALAKGEAADEAAARKLAQDFFIGQISNSMGDAAAEALADAVDIKVTTTTKNNGKSFEVQVGSTYDLALTPLMGVLGYQTVDIAVNSASTSGTSDTRSALSMTLVLDESGSMLADTNSLPAEWKKCKHYNTNGSSIGTWAPCNIKKIEALKTASDLLLDQLDNADPNSEFVRTSAIAWSTEINESSELAWGTSKARSEVISRLSGGGRTESSVPMATAYAGLTKTGSDSEEAIHKKEDNNTIQKYIVFMTDGSNNEKYSDRNTLLTCAAAKKENIKIYSIAFMAPKEGQNLLKACATDSSSYYVAESMEALLKAFTAIGQDAAKDKTLLIN